MSGTERIAEAFARSGKRAALMPYAMGGFPDQAGSQGILDAYADAGADLIELGVPFSDPLADGPAIHDAATAALSRGATVDRVLQLVTHVSERVPTVVMCYANLVIARGMEAFADSLAGAGAAGLIVPDLPLEEAPVALEACDAAGIALVPLVAPTTPAERMGRIGAMARGFVYTVSVAGTTGERTALSETLAGVVADAKAHFEVPVAVGFGISTPEHAVAAADAGADGVIVGSRLVRAAGEATDPPAAVRELVEGLADALRGTPTASAPAGR